MMEEHEVWTKLLLQRGEGVLLLDAASRILRQNEVAASLLGRAPGEELSIRTDAQGRAVVTQADGARVMVTAEILPTTEQRTLVVLAPPRAVFARGSEEMSEALLSGYEVGGVLEALSAITGRTLDVDRSFIYEIRVDTQEVIALCQWINPEIDVAPTKGKYPLSVFAGGDRWVRETGRWLESHIEAPHQALLSDGSAAMLHGPMAIKSLLWAPFGFRPSRYYALVLNQVEQRRAWLPEEREFLRVAIRRVTAALRQIALDEEEARKERAILEAQKLETVRLLAGGVAHDLGSHLGIVLGTLDRARHELPASSAVAAILRDAESAAIEASRLAKHLLAYAGKGQFVVEPIDLAATVDDMRQLLKAAGGSVKLRIEHDQEGAWLLADATQVRQVLMNLVINAVEAIGDGNGSVVVGVRASPSGPAAAASKLGRAVVLQVTDTGSGIAPELEARILEPFFSTKGGGRGLGLAAVAGIVRAHHGDLHVASSPGTGTTFTLSFPAVPMPIALSAPPPTPPPRVELAGTVLLADDTDSLRKTTARLLQILGFSVTSLADGTKVNALIEERSDIDLLLLDWTIAPGGAEIVRRARAARPGLAIVVMSGYAKEAVALERDGRTTFLEKPFRVEELEGALRSVLAGRADAGGAPISATQSAGLWRRDAT